MVPVGYQSSIQGATETAAADLVKDTPAVPPEASNKENASVNVSSNDANAASTSSSQNGNANSETNLNDANASSNSAAGADTSETFEYELSDDDGSTAAYAQMDFSTKEMKELRKLYLAKCGDDFVKLLEEADFWEHHLNGWYLDKPHVSLAQKHGVWLKPKSTNKEKREFWYCLEPSCNKPEGRVGGPLRLSVKGCTTRAFNHCKAMHLTKEAKDDIAEARITELEKELAGNDPLFKANPKRYHYLKVADFFVDNLLPLSICEKESFREMMKMSESMVPIYIKKLKQTFVEIYLHITRLVSSSSKGVIILISRIKVREKVNEMVQVFGSNARMFQAYIDLWDAEVEDTKYLGVRVLWRDPKGEIQSHSLGITPYMPSSSETDNEAASRLIGKWALEVREHS